MSSKTVVEEFDTQTGKLIKRTVITKEDEVQIPNGYPYKPYRPWEPPRMPGQPQIWC